MNISSYIAVWVLLWHFVFPTLSIAATKNTNSQLKNVERAINLDKKQHKDLQETSIDLRNDLERLKAQTVKLAAAIQQQETNAFDLNDTLQQLHQNEREKLKLLAGKREQFSYVLMALQRMARHPPEAMIVAPISPSETVRVAILLRAANFSLESTVGYFFFVSAPYS